jgi:Na+/proline symporter
MHAPDLAVLIAYFATMVVVGFAYSRQMKSLDLYFGGGKELSWWLGGISYVMAYVSALSIVVYAGLGYRYGLVALTLYWTTVPSTLVTTWLFARRWRRAGVLTPMEFLETRFSSTMRQLFVWSGIPLRLIDEGLKIVAIAIFVAAGLKTSPAAAMLAVGLITLFYTVAGGLWGVVITIFVQFVLVSTALVMLVPLAWQAAGGWSHFISAIPADFLRPAHPPYTWEYIAAFSIFSALSLAGNWSLIQRFYCARSDREAYGVGLFASLLFLLLPPLWVFTGIFARAFIPFGKFDPQAIYAHVSVALLPPGMLGLLIAALFAATMSVLASGYNVIAAVLTVDVHQRLIHPAATQRELVVVGRLLTALVALFPLGIALVVTYAHWTVFDTMVAAFSFFLPPTVLPVLAGLLSRRLSAAGALAGFVAGFGTGLAFLVYKWAFQPANLSLYQEAALVIPTGITTLVLIVAACAFPAKGEARERANAFFDRLARPAPPTASSEAAVGPVVGMVIGAMGLVLLVVGSGLLTPHSSPLTLGTGGTFTALGILLCGQKWLRKSGDRMIG